MLRAIHVPSTEALLLQSFSNNSIIAKHPHIVIIGAGIVGASLAYHLARRNAHVTLIDKATAPDNVSKKSFGWINAGHNGPEAYLHLRQQAIADWHRVEDELKGKLLIDWSGALSWLENAADTEHLADELSASGYPVRFVNTREIRLLEPNLKKAPAGALFAAADGAINPTLATELLIKAARTNRVSFQPDNEALSLITSGSRVAGIATANGKLIADVVVLAAGAGAITLCTPLGLTLPITASPAVLMKFHNPHRFINRIVSNPYMEIRAASNTLTIAAEDYIDETPENNPLAIAQRTLENIRNHWQGAEEIMLGGVLVGSRPIPQDGLPIIGQMPNIEGLYTSVMHAGITLAAIAGRLAAAEILSDRDEKLLSCYRPERFD